MKAGVDLTSTIVGYRSIEELCCGSRTLIYRAIREAIDSLLSSKFYVETIPAFTRCCNSAISIPLPRIYVNPNILEGTLAYISPKQTGRIDREIDITPTFLLWVLPFMKY